MKERPLPDKAFEEHARYLLDGVYEWSGYEQGGNDHDDWYVDERRDADWRRFWKLARDVEQSAAVKIIQAHQDWRNRLRVHTLGTLGNKVWQPLSRTLLPGSIVGVQQVVAQYERLQAAWALHDEISAKLRELIKSVKRTRRIPYSHNVIDIDFHQAERSLLEQLGAVAEPHTMDGKSLDVYSSFFNGCRDAYYLRLPQNLDPHRRYRRYLRFDPVETSGPLAVLEFLSDAGKVRYTEALLNLPATYNDWIMRRGSHKSYPRIPFKSPAVAVLREHGRISTDDGIQKLSDGLGSEPKDREVLRELIRHPQARRICQAFDLEVETDLAEVEPSGVDDPVPLLDVWPGLEAYLSSSQQSLMLIRCDRIAKPDGLALGPDCIVGRDNTTSTKNIADTATPPEGKAAVKAPAKDNSTNAGIDPATQALPAKIHAHAEHTASALSGADAFALIREIQAERERKKAKRRARIAVWAEGTLYLERKDDKRAELQSVTRALELDCDIEEILRHQPRSEIDKARARVRGCATDVERLLAAIGEDKLRSGLPESLLEILDVAPVPLTGLQVAEAAIATYHTGALREYRHALNHLDPPKQWAGTRPAVGFVQSLGFGAEWAGEQNRKRDPYIEVEGPYSLPPLHDYQHTVVQKLRHMLRADGVWEAKGAA